MEVQIESIIKMCESDSLRWTNHALVRLLQRDIKIDDVICALQKGKIIEHYPTDYPYPSCLVLGTSIKGQPLHVVCGLGDSELWLITAYYPTADKWSDDFTTRKENE